MSSKKCRVCGCTDQTACTTAAGPCHWVEQDLCSACAEPSQQGVLRATDLEALMSAEGLSFNLPAAHSFMLLSLIQLALRHPDVSPNEMVAQFGNVFGRQLQEKLSVTPNLAAVCEAGWIPQIVEEEQSPIVFPPGYIK